MTDTPSSALPVADGQAPHDALDVDVAIVGAGPVGLALAGWLAQRRGAGALSVALIDARAREAALADPRVLALSEGSRSLLAPLGWPEDATPIERIHVSQRGHFGRVMLDRHDYGLPALGHVMRYGALVSALSGAVDRGGPGARVQRLDGVRALPYAAQGDSVHLPLQAAAGGAAPGALRARVLVSAEGGVFSAGAGTGPLSRLAPDAPRRAYGQSALIGLVCCERPAVGLACERFTADGPLALLPLSRARVAPGTPRADYALVWCDTPQTSQRRLQADERTVLDELASAFGGRFGRFTSLSGRAMFELGMQFGSTRLAPRVVAIGNAAQILHPVAGQGLNLGLRDARALADLLSTVGATPEALGELDRRRGFDRRLTGTLSDLLARGFVSRLPGIGHARGLGLFALEALPGAKSLLARQMIYGARR